VEFMVKGFLKGQSLIRKQPGRLETYEQQEFVKYARMIMKDEYRNLLFSIPNEAKRSMSTASRMKAEGMVAGVPDLFLAISSGEYHGLFIEMKRINRAVVSDSQKIMIELLKDQGFKVVICEGSVSAMDEFRAYLKGKNTLKGQLKT